MVMEKTKIESENKTPVSLLIRAGLTERALGRGRGAVRFASFARRFLFKETAYGLKYRIFMNLARSSL